VLWERMQKNNFQGLANKEDLKERNFIKSIADKKRVHIGTSFGLMMNVINYCTKYPELNLFISRDLFMPSEMAFAFKLDFDQKIINKINKM